MKNRKNQTAEPNENRHRGRPPMTEAEKQAAKVQREQAAKDRQNAIKAISENGQFTDARTWAALDPVKLSQIEAAIAHAKTRFRKAEIDSLRKRLVALEAEAKG